MKTEQGDGSSSKPRFQTRDQVNGWLELHGQSVVESPVSEVARNLWEAVKPETTPALLPWKKFLGKKLWKEENEAVLRELTTRYRATTPAGSEQPQAAVRWWNEVFLPTQETVLNSLKPAAVRRDLVRVLLSQERNPSQRTVLERILGTEVPVYCRTSSRTGRMVVKAGPDFTVLRHEYRDRILQSRWGPTGGSIWWLDYNALEPRTLLALQRPLLSESPDLDLSRDNSPSSDLYTSLQLLFPGEKPSRDDFKQAVISILYGAKPTSRVLADFLYTTFKVDSFLEYLEQQTGLYFGKKIHSYYGRPVWLDPEQQQTHKANKHKLLNYLVQSTAVDIALLGFRNIINTTQELALQEHVVPIFLIHDSLWLDVHKSVEEGVIKRLTEAGGTDIPGLPGVFFPMKAKRLGDSTHDGGKALAGALVPG